MRWLRFLAPKSCYLSAAIWICTRGSSPHLYLYSQAKCFTTIRPLNSDKGGPMLASYEGDQIVPEPFWMPVTNVLNMQHNKTIEERPSLVMIPRNPGIPGKKAEIFRILSRESRNCLDFYQGSRGRDDGSQLATASVWLNKPICFCETQMHIFIIENELEVLLI